MGFPRRLLTPGEQVVLQSNPNWSVLVRPLLASLAIIAACVAVFVVWTGAPIYFDYALLTVGCLAGLYLVGKLAGWRSCLLVITTIRVVYRSGVVRRTGREIPLDRIQDVTYHQTLLQRLVRAGSLTIESAGATGQEPFPDIGRPAEVQSLVNRLISERSEGSGGGVGDPLASPARRVASARRRSPSWRAHTDEPTDEVEAVRAGYPPAADEEPASYREPQARGLQEPGTQVQGPQVPGSLAHDLRRLEELHDLGVITSAEFDKQRKSLLGLA
ncbi:MAG: PH domain-containing protein [Acidimicrobiales bacterium]